MTDVARLGFSAETGPLTKATADLNALVPAAKRAESAVEGFNQEASSIGAATRAAASGLSGLSSGVGHVAAGLAGIDGAAAGAASGLSGVGRSALMAGTAMGTVQAAAAGVKTGFTGISATLGATKGQLDQHVQLWRMYQAELAQIPGAANQARSSLDRLGNAANDNINRLQSTPGNIAAQFQDIGVSAAGGMQPLLIALQQGTQLGAAMTGGLGNLKAAFAQVFSPVNLVTIAIVALVAVLIQAGIAYFSASDGADELAKATKELTDATNDLHASTVASVRSTYASIQADIAKANSLRVRATETRALLVDELKLAKARLQSSQEMMKQPGGAFSTLENTMGAQQTGAVTYKQQAAEIKRLDAEIAVASKNIKTNSETIRMATGQLVNLELGAKLDATAGATLKFDKSMDGLNQRLRTGQISINDYAKASWQLNKTLLDEKEAIADSERSHSQRKKTMTDAEREAKRLAKAAEQDLKQRIKASEDYADQLEIEAKNIGLTAVEIKRVEVAAKVAAAPLATLAVEISRAGKAWETAFAQNELTQQGKRLEELQQEIQLEQDLAVLRLEATENLTGGALKNEMKEIALWGEKQKNEAKATLEYNEYMRMALGASSDEAVNLWTQLAEGAKQSADLKNNALQTAHNLALATDEAARLAGQLDRALSSFDRMTGLNLSGMMKDLRKGFPDFAKGLDKAFGGLKDAADGILKGLGSSLKQVGAGIAIGGAVDSIFDAIGVKSSKTGAQVGGAIGQFAGPLGAIAGSIIGGIVGGMMKSTPRASATVSIIAGEAMDTAIKGSSGKLKAIAGEMANGVISGLEQLATALGAQLTGDAKVSIGMRNDKYRVDTTGSGITKTSKGAVDFGEDKAAAIAFALQDAIKDGVLGGLSASLTKLITADGDLQANLSKALSFKSVFDELAKIDDPIKFAQDEITRWYDSMKAIFEQAGATSEELASLERLTGIKRVEAAKTAGNDLTAIERDRKNLLIQIAELEGKSIDALTMRREMEKAAADASLGPLYDRIYALEDEATAAAALKAIADERYGLETQLLQLQGNTVALRQRELDVINPSNQAMQQLIWSLEDQAVATQAAADAAQAARSIYEKQLGIEAQIMTLQGNASGALRIQRELELKATDASIRPLLMRLYALEDEATATEALKAIADERYGLETQLLQLQGNTVALRARELAVLDPSNQAIQQLIWSLQDQAVATQAAADAAAELAAKQKAIADERYGLEDRYLNLIGDTAALRKRELDALLSDDNRAYLQMIFDTQDAMAAAAKAAEETRAAQEAYNNALKDAKDVLLDTYKRERAELQATADTFRKFIQTIREFRYSLADAINPVEGFRLITKQYNEAINSGDASQYTNAAKKYIDAAKGRAHNMAEFSEVVGRVRADASNLERGAGSRVYTAERQMMLMDEQVGALIEIHDAVVTLPEAIANFISIRDEGIFSNIMDTQTEMLRDEVEQLRTDNNELMHRLTELNESSAANISRLYNLFDDVIVGEGLQVTNIPGQPIQTEAV